jgi:hypothetical protein
MSNPAIGVTAPLLASAVAVNCRLGNNARGLLGATLTAGAYLDLLNKHELYLDGVRFLAMALPRRLAVWWGCLCVWQTERTELSRELSAALQAAVRWVVDPSEENRRAAEGPAQPDDFETAESCLAMAAHWSGGSMLPPGLPVVPPAEILTGKLVGGAILLAATQRGPSETHKLLRQSLSIGRDVARGNQLWTEYDLSLMEAQEAQQTQFGTRQETATLPVESTTITVPASV